MPPKKGIEGEKRGRGRPRQRPTNKEEAKRQAEEMFDDFKNNKLDITEGALRRKINLLGEVPGTGGRERWFSYSNRRGTPRIVDYERSTPRVEEAKSSVAEDIKRQQDEDEMKKQKKEETLREQVDIEKVQAQERAKAKEVEKKFGEFKPLEGEQLRRFRGEETLEDLRKLIRGERKMDQSLFDKIADVLGEEKKPLEAPEVKREVKREVKKPKVKKPEVPEFDWSEIVIDPAEAQKEMEDFKEVEEEKVQMKKKRREEAYVAVPPKGKRVKKGEGLPVIPPKPPVGEPALPSTVDKQKGKIYGHDFDYKHNVEPPYINELINGEIEQIPDLEDLNQNVFGINERKLRNLIDEFDDDLISRSVQFLLQDEEEKKRVGINVEEDEYEPLLIPDAEARASREVSNAREYLARRYGERKAQERANLFPELQEEARRLLSNAIENKMQELGMNVPEEIKTMASETLSGLLKDAKIGLSLEDIENLIQQEGIPVSEIAQQLPSAIASRLPELKSVGRQIASRIPEGMKNNISAGLGLASDAYGVYDRLPEGMKKKIREAGGTAKDIAISKIKGSFVGEEKEEKEGKEGEPRRIGLFGEPEEEEGKEGEVRRARPEPEEKDPQDLLLEQINNINARLGGLGGGEGKLAYPEERKTKPYKFPKPNENYDAVQLIQNSTTGFLNELNLYGDVGINDDI